MNRRDFIKRTTLAVGALAALPITAAVTKKPNILLILADDMGYSDASCYGGEIHTPNLAKLAENGVRFSQHYSTGRCWPSRACILTGHYAQPIGRDRMKGYNLGNRPKWAPLLPEMLKPLGYRSYHSGKWHIDGTPIEGGFDRSWGQERPKSKDAELIGCDWDRYFSSERWVEGKYTAPVKEGEPYYSTVALADHAIACLKLHQEEYADKPFFQYVAFYSPHFPLHALPEDINRYKDTYREGWDSIRTKRWERMKKMGLINCGLSKLQPEITTGYNQKPEVLKEVYGNGEEGTAVAWDSLTDEQKKFQPTKMAIHAAMITRMDLEIGRIIEQLKAMGEFDNTLIMFASDNGASAEMLNRGDKHSKGSVPGSAEIYLCLGPAWGSAANTPFRFHKAWNHEGGISSPFIAHWPNGINAKGEIRHDPSHLIDVVPTSLDVAGGTCKDRPGLSLVPAFEKDGAVQHESLWWGHHGNKGLRMGDWKISAAKQMKGVWELYDMKTDRSEMENLAEKHPEILQKLTKRWDEIEAGFMEKLKE